MHDLAFRNVREMNLHFIKKLKHKLIELHFEESLLFLIIGILSALICSLYAYLFSLAEHASLNLFHYNALLPFIVSPIAMMLSFIAVNYIAPGSSGSGIPQVLACIEYRDEGLAKKFLRKTVIVIKIFSSFLAVFAGAAIGREGPSLQISAAISYSAGKFFERMFGLKVKVEQLLVAGAAGGLAAAFNTPIGGVVFAIEELSKEHVRNFRDVLLLSVVISGITAQLINGNYLYLGYPHIPDYHSFWGYALVLLAGVTTGVLGGLSSKMLLALIKWRSALSIKKQIIIAGLAGLIFAFTFYFLGERNIYSGKESINAVLFNSKFIPWYETFTRMIMPIVSSMTGVAGGIFAPALSAGATVGSLIASLIDSDLQVVLGLCGMVGFLTGLTHTPITSFILVLEMTDRHSAVFPMMLAALCSSLSSHLVSKKSFYEEVVEAVYKPVKS